MRLEWLCVEQSRELFSDIRGRGEVSDAWEVPSEPRGVILAHSYCLVETDNTNNVIIEDTNTTDQSVLESVTVSPFTNYTATVVAYTSAGGGNSVIEVAISPEASKFIWWNCDS